MAVLAMGASRGDRNQVHRRVRRRCRTRRRQGPRADLKFFARHRSISNTYGVAVRRMQAEHSGRAICKRYGDRRFRTFRLSE
jgi:hypothetical protein